MDIPVCDSAKSADRDAGAYRNADPNEYTDKYIGSRDTDLDIFSY